MAKTIIPKKMIIELNENGTFNRGVLMYRVAIDGVWEQKLRTIGLSGPLAKTQELQNQTNKIMDKAVQHVLKGEGLA